MERVTDTHQWSMDSLSGLCRGIIHSPRSTLRLSLHDVTPLGWSSLDALCSTVAALALKHWENKHMHKKKKKKKEKKKNHHSNPSSPPAWRLIFTTSPQRERESERGRGGWAREPMCKHLQMKTKQHLLTNTVTRALEHIQLHPLAGEAPPSPVCIAPKSAASFPRQFFISRAKETQQHPATSYSRPQLSSLSLSLSLFLSLTVSLFLFSGFGRAVKCYRWKAFFFRLINVTLQGRGASWFCWAKPLENFSPACYL